MKRQLSCYCWIVSFGILVSITCARADTAELLGNTLLCTNVEDPDHAWYGPIRLYVTKERVFYVHGSKPSSEGRIYDYGRTRSETAGVNLYKTSAAIEANAIELKVTMTIRDCTICSGKIIMRGEVAKLFAQNNGWFLKNDFRQWFPDGTKAAAPRGSALYSCKLFLGRVGVGG